MGSRRKHSRRRIWAGYLVGAALSAALLFWIQGCEEQPPLTLTRRADPTVVVEQLAGRGGVGVTAQPLLACDLKVAIDGAMSWYDRQKTQFTCTRSTERPQIGSACPGGGYKFYCTSPNFPTQTLSGYAGSWCATGQNSDTATNTVQFRTGNGPWNFYENFYTKCVGNFAWHGWNP